MINKVVEDYERKTKNETKYVSSIKVWHKYVDKEINKINLEPSHWYSLPSSSSSDLNDTPQFNLKAMIDGSIKTANL